LESRFEVSPDSSQVLTRVRIFEKFWNDSDIVGLKSGWR